MPWTFYTATGQQLKSTVTNISNLDIDGATDIGEAIANGDLLIIDNGADGTNRKTTVDRLKTYVGAAASQTEMESASSNTVFATPGRTQHHPGVAKAWGLADNNGTFTVRASYNDSQTDAGPGIVLHTFGTDFSSIYYAFVGATNGSQFVTTALQAADSCRVDSKNTTDQAAADVDWIACVFFGDQA